MSHLESSLGKEILLSHLVRCLWALPLRSCPTRLAVGQGPSPVGLLRVDPSLALPGFTLQGPQRPYPLSFCCCCCLLLPRDGPGSETEGSEDSGEKCPLSQLASFPPGAPVTMAAHMSHCDPGLWPCLLLTQWFPIVWGKREGGHRSLLPT